MKSFLLATAVAGLLALPALASAQTEAQREAAERQHQATVHQTTVNRTEVTHSRTVEHWDRTNATWWRGRPEFHDYVGVRPGYWYRPGYGYWRPGPAWYGYSWRVGVVVPFGFRSYAVANPYFYGLTPAPYGFRYIWVANHIALINVNTGVISSIVFNVY